jgi:hypothetical protein
MAGSTSSAAAPRTNALGVKGILSGLAVAVILAAGYVVYAPGLSGPFLFDDFPNIVNNGHLKMAALSLDQILSAAFSSRAGPLYRPIAMASFALNRYFTGLDPYWFKFTNVMIHLACGVLVIALVRLLLASYREQRDWRVGPARARWVALAVAAAWVVLPLNLTAVLYVVQRMVSLASFFMLAAFLCYVAGRRRQLARRSGWAFIWIGAPVFAVLGLFTKEIAALVPLYLLMIEAVIFRFRGGRGRHDKSIIVYFTLGLAIPFLIGLGWLLTHLHGFLAGYNSRDFTIVERLLTEARVLMLDVKWTLIPNVGDLSLYHDDLGISTGLLQPVTTLLSFIGIAAMLALAWLTRRRAPLVTLGVLWFLAGHALESTILPLELVHEHRNYLPDMGLVLAVVSLFVLIRPSKRALLTAGSAVAVLFIGLLSVVTFARASDWGTKITQACYEARYHPHSPRATYSCAAAEASLAMQGRLENPDTAFTALEKSRATNKSVMPNVALVMLASSLGRPVKPEWLDDMREKLHASKIGPQDVDALSRLVQCEREACQLDRRQVDSIFNAARTNPRLGHGYNYANVTTIYINYLTAENAPLAKLIELMRKVAAAEPHIAQYHINLGNALIVAGKLDDAQKQIDILRQMNSVGQYDRAIHRLKAKAAKKGESG